MFIVPVPVFTFWPKLGRFMLMVVMKVVVVGALGSVQRIRTSHTNGSVTGTASSSGSKSISEILIEWFGTSGGA